MATIKKFRKSRKGTRLFCPCCERVQQCRTLPLRACDGDHDSHQRWTAHHYRRTKWFRRKRVCLKCEFEFITCEIEECFIDELIETRDSIRVIRTAMAQIASDEKVLAAHPALRLIIEQLEETAEPEYTAERLS